MMSLPDLLYSYSPTNCSRSRAFGLCKHSNSRLSTSNEAYIFITAPPMTSGTPKKTHRNNNNINILLLLLVMVLDIKMMLDDTFPENPVNRNNVVVCK